MNEKCLHSLHLNLIINPQGISIKRDGIFFKSDKCLSHFENRENSHFQTKIPSIKFLIPISHQSTFMRRKRECFYVFEFFFFFFFLIGNINYIKRQLKGHIKHAWCIQVDKGQKKQRGTQKTTPSPYLQLNQTIKSNNDKELSPMCTPNPF